MQSLVGNNILILSFQFGQAKSGAKIKIFMRIKKEIVRIDVSGYQAQETASIASSTEGI
jgi:hypothetical protein